MTEDRKRRISLTKLQRETAVGVELIALCQSVSQDGKLSDDEVAALRQWLEDGQDSDLPAIDVLRETVNAILADGVVTEEERRTLYETIEKVLPIDIRESVRGQRIAVEKIERETAREAARAAAEEEKRLNTPLGRWDFMVAGVAHEGRPEIIEHHANPGDAAFLVRDPANQYSRNAVEVRLSNGMQIGYVPERFAGDVAPLLDAGNAHDAFIKKILTGGRAPIPVIVANVYPALESAADSRDSRPLNETAGAAIHSSPAQENVVKPLFPRAARSDASEGNRFTKILAMVVIICILVAVVVFFRDPKIDQKKFEPLYLVGKQLELLSPSEFSGLQEKLRFELSIARDRATTAAERKMVDLYDDAWIAVLDADYDHRLKMIRREQELSGTRKDTKKDQAEPDPRLGSWQLLQIANRCYASMGKDCAEPQGLSKKRADEVARARDEEIEKEKKDAGRSRKPRKSGAR